MVNARRPRVRVASDGGIFSFGDGQYYGAASGPTPQQTRRHHHTNCRRTRLLARRSRRRHLHLLATRCTTDPHEPHAHPARYRHQTHPQRIRPRNHKPQLPIQQHRQPNHHHRPPTHATRRRNHSLTLLTAAQNKPVRSRASNIPRRLDRRNERSPKLFPLHSMQIKAAPLGTGWRASETARSVRDEGYVQSIRARIVAVAMTGSTDICISSAPSR
jgi:hypothetical protein